MEIRILGPVEVWDSGEPRPLGGTKQRAVLAMLALHANQVVSSDHLIDGLWADQASERSANSVQVYVSRLRKILGSDHPDPGGTAALSLQRRNPGYLLRVDGDRLDLARFNRLARDGVAELDRSPRLAAATLRLALDLWRGPALAEFRSQPFAQAEITGLQEQHLAALGARIDADLMLGRHAELLAELETLSSAHPLHERFQHQLILALYRTGRQADALDAYRRLRRTLAVELGIEPSRSLHDLEEAVLNHDPRLDWQAPTIPEPAIDAAPNSVVGPPAPVGPNDRTFPEVWNLPARNPRFTGRTPILDEMRRRLRGNESALVVQALHGLGGIGKTQLALEFAHRFAGDYRLIWWIDAERPVLIPEQIGQLASALGIRVPGSMGDTVRSVLTALAARTDWLLIFDNAERAEAVASYRPLGAGHILVTSRRPGWGALGGRLPVDVLERSETVALLQDRLDSIGPGLAGELAAELGDLPLAVAQAAAYIEQSGMTPEDYLRQFSTRRSALLARGDVLDYQGRVDTTWLLSLDRLAARCPQALTLMRLSAFLAAEPIPLTLLTGRPGVFGGSNSTEDAEKLSDAVGEAVGFSLVRRFPDAFQVHRLVQAVIRKTMTPELYKATSATVADLLVAANPKVPNDPTHWAAYARLTPHVLAFGAEADNRPDTRHLVIEIVTYLNLNADNNASRRLGEDFLARWTHKFGPDHPDALILASHLMLPMIWMGDVKDARSLSERLLPRARLSLGEGHPATLRMAGFLVMTLVWLGQSESARTLAYDTMAKARRSLSMDDPDMLRLSTYVSLALAWVGDSAARTIARETLEHSRAVLGPNHPTTLFAAVDLAFGLLETGDTVEIRSLGADTLQRSTQTLGPRHLLTLGAAAVLAQAMAWDGDVDAALRLGREYLDHTRYHLGPDHLITLTAATALASAHAASDRADAEPLGPEVLVGPHTALGPDHPISLITAAAVCRSMARRADGDPAGSVANPLAVDTLARAQRRLGDAHPLTIGLRRALAPHVVR